MAFFQAPPELGNQYRDDALITEYVARVMPPDALSRLEDEYDDVGQLSGGEYYRAQLEDLPNEPVHVPWDAWGNRVDRIDVSPLWRRAQVLSAQRGLVAAAYEGTYGSLSRVHQCLLNYLIAPSLDIYSCPLAMTDGAARTLLDSGNQHLIERAIPRLTSRDPAVMWTSGQWMTERTGGSDVGTSETVARLSDVAARSQPHGGDDRWRLFGTKWFTSAATGQMALTLARPEGNGPGGRGLALFYVEAHDDSGRLRNIQINRLKNKFGTRKVPTAELTLDGTPATLVVEPQNGVRHIAPMLNVTRLWNAMMAASGMRRAVALAKDYARRRSAFGTTLGEKPLHVDTLASIQAETEGAVLLALRTAELLGNREAGEADHHQQLLARVLTPIAKLTTGKQAVAVASEALECFGGAGYVEDTGLPRLLADAQVLPIWEGTTNVLSLDTLRALAQEGAFEALTAEVTEKLGEVRAAQLGDPANVAQRSLGHATEWLTRAMGKNAVLEAGARRFAMTIGRTVELTLLTHHAQWCLDHHRGPRASAAARRFAQNRVDLILDHDAEEVSADAHLLFEL
ncbi:MAG: acyl-CoA dehydrogenase family protein [Proteobacteria bacterium]|nr:acyl-CoA dehydrogenase family protein [Pseudomonadota bacterium]